MNPSRISQENHQAISEAQNQSSMVPVPLLPRILFTLHESSGSNTPARASSIGGPASPISLDSSPVESDPCLCVSRVCFLANM